MPLVKGTAFKPETTVFFYDNHRNDDKNSHEVSQASTVVSSLKSSNDPLGASREHSKIKSRSPPQRNGGGVGGIAKLAADRRLSNCSSSFDHDGSVEQVVPGKNLALPSTGAFLSTSNDSQKISASLGKLTNITSGYNKAKKQQSQNGSISSSHQQVSQPKANLESPFLRPKNGCRENSPIETTSSHGSDHLSSLTTHSRHASDMEITSGSSRLQNYSHDYYSSQNWQHEIVEGGEVGEEEEEESDVTVGILDTSQVSLRKAQIQDHSQVSLAEAAFHRQLRAEVRRFKSKELRTKFFTGDNTNSNVSSSSFENSSISYIPPPAPKPSLSHQLPSLPGNVLIFPPVEDENFQQHPAAAAAVVPEQGLSDQ